MEKGVFLIFPVKDIQLAALLQNFKGPKIFINFQFHQFYRERRSFLWPLVTFMRVFVLGQKTLPSLDGFSDHCNNGFP